MRIISRILFQLVNGPKPFLKARTTGRSPLNRRDNVAEERQLTAEVYKLVLPAVGKEPMVAVVEKEAHFVLNPLGLAPILAAQRSTCCRIRFLIRSASGLL